jgi:signal transduction histidine kinase
VFDITAVYAGFAYQTRNMLITNVSVLAVLAVALYVLSAGLTRPISKLSKAAERIASGRYGERVPIRGDDEVAALSRQFNKMSDSVEQNITRLEDYAKSRDDFVANFSHELKTPMTSIIGYADLLRTRKNDESIIEEAADFIYSEGKRLESLSHRLLTLMKLRQTKLQLTANDLAPVLDEVINSTRPACSKKDISLTLSSHPKQAAFDTALLEMLLINLIHNACEACSRGGNIHIDFHERETRLCVSVKDDGCGIPENELSNISDEFYRVDKSRKHTDGNFGLGLSICKEIARLHGSELLIQSEPNKGTAVSFELEAEVEV